MTVSSTDSAHHRHYFPSSSCHSNQKIHHSPKAKKKFPNQQIVATVAGKQHTGAVDALKQTKTEIDAEGKFNFNYVCSEDDLMVNKETFDQIMRILRNLIFHSKGTLKEISPTGKIL